MFADSGLACHLLGITDRPTLNRSPFLGPFYEGVVAAEIAKHRLNRGQARNLYYFRDRQGLEVDFIVDAGNRRLVLIEAKATHTPMPADARALGRLAAGIKRYRTSSWLIQRGSTPTASLAPGIRLATVGQLPIILDEV